MGYDFFARPYFLCIDMGLFILPNPFADSRPRSVLFRRPNSKRTITDDYDLAARDELHRDAEVLAALRTPYPALDCVVGGIEQLFLLRGQERLVVAAHQSSSIFFPVTKYRPCPTRSRYPSRTPRVSAPPVLANLAPN